MATKAFDLSKFRKTLTKSIDGLGVGFNDPTDWISTGNFALNYLISSDFHKGVPLGKVTVFAGESGAGKSFICSGNLIRNAQLQGIYVVLIDSENALDQAWLEALGVDTSEEKLLKLNMAMIDDVAKTVNEFMKEYKTMEERPKVLFVIDSLGMLLTPTDVNQFEAGDLKGDMGRKPKALTALVRNCVNMFGSYNVGLVATNHTYASQDMFDPDDKISGGQGFIYASSIVVAMKKLKLKEDEDGNKISEIRGIRSACKIMKTRYAKPFESVQIKIPYETGMNPYSGLVDLFESKNLLQKDGNRLKYLGIDGNEVKMYRKEWERNENGGLDKIMAEFNSRAPLNPTIDNETGEILENE
jgi:recombination protein RecA